MALKLGNTNIGEIYLGNTKIAEAYLGSTLVFQISQPPAGYDSYVIHLTWNNLGTFVMAGMRIDGIQATTSQVTSMRYYNWDWVDVSSSDIANAIYWDEWSNCFSFNATAIDINFTSENIPSTVQIKTYKWWGGTPDETTMHVAGVKNGVETDLGYTRQYNGANIIYTVNINDADNDD